MLDISYTDLYNDDRRNDGIFRPVKFKPTFIISAKIYDLTETFTRTQAKNTRNQHISFRLFKKIWFELFGNRAEEFSEKENRPNQKWYSLYFQISNSLNLTYILCSSI